MRSSRDAAPRSHWMTSLRVESRQAWRGCRRALSAVNLGKIPTGGYDVDVLNKDNQLLC